MSHHPDLITFPVPTLAEAISLPLATVTPIRPEIGAHQGEHRDHDVSRAACDCTEDVWDPAFTEPCPRHESRAYSMLRAQHSTDVSA